MLFMQISKHAPESCPMHNEKAKKAFADLMAKLGPLTKKHGIKLVGSWTSMPEHLIVNVFDAPNMETLLKLTMEPISMNWLAYNTTETRPVMTTEEVMKILK